MTALPLHIAAYQGPFAVAQPDTPPSVEELTRAIADAAAQAAAAGARVLVTPEMSLTGYNIDDEIRRAHAADVDLDAVAEIARRHDIYIIVGFPSDAGQGNLYNTAAVIGPEGEIARYHKTHLYGDLDKGAFVAGDELVVQFEIDGVCCGLIICYDVEFPEIVRAHAVAGTHVLFVPTGLMEPYSFIARDIVRARAFESQMFIAYTNRCGTEGELTYTGTSRIFAPSGDAIAEAGTQAELIDAILEPADLAASRRENTYLTDRRADLYSKAQAERS